MKSSENNLEQAENHPLHIYLPYKKYITKATKQHLSRKKEAIASVPLDKHLIKQALESLKKYEETHCNVTDLFADDGFIYAQIELSVIPEHHSIRPVQIPLPIPIYSQQYHSRFTIFSCDPEKELTDRLQHLQVPQIGEVIGYERVKKHYRENKDKLKLLASNDLFFCDWRIYNLLRQPLGKLFYEKKKYIDLHLGSPTPSIASRCPTT